MGEHCAALSENVGHDPVGVEMLSEKIVLFRDDSGKVVAINDVCPHRGAPLHEGAPPPAAFSPPLTAAASSAALQFPAAKPI